MADYFVKKIEVCPKCKGKQFTPHPAWEEYWQENSNKGLSMSPEEDRKWFEDHGWYVGSCIDIRTDGLPDEEIACGECEGEGEIISEVDLLKVLPELLESLKSQEK